MSSKTCLTNNELIATVRELQTVTANSGSKVRYEKIGSVEYLVAPVSMLVPGVLSGSKGPLLYPREEVTKNVLAWNHMPLTLGHPTENGRGVSARSPKILERYMLGHVFNAHSRKGKLDAEAWFDIKRTNELAPSIVSAIESGQPIELSTGLFTKNTPVRNGMSFNGRSYVAIASDYKPDHLAVLLDTRGACSIEDGCGVLVNEATDTTDCGCGCKGKKKKKRKCPFGVGCQTETIIANWFVTNELLTDNNCGIGSKGFEPGNSCAGGGGSEEYEGYKLTPGVTNPNGKASVAKKDNPDKSIGKLLKYQDGNWAATLMNDGAVVQQVGNFSSKQKAFQGLVQAHKEHEASSIEPGTLVWPEEETYEGAFKKAMPDQSTADTFTVVKSLGGSTGAQLIEDPATGERYVKKRGSSEGHLLNEFAAEEAYRAANVPTVDSAMYGDTQGKYKLHRYIEGTLLSDLSGQEKLDAIKKVQKDFAVDATLGNWDVVGLSQDNILVGKDGIPYRIDAGGALAYRAGGQPKGSAWNKENVEVNTLRTNPKNPSSTAVFGKMTDEEVLQSFETHSKNLQPIIDSLVKTSGTEMASLVGSRFASGWNKVESQFLGSAPPEVSKVSEASFSDAKSLSSYMTKMAAGYKLSGFTSKHVEKVEFLNPNGIENGTFTIPLTGPLTTDKHQELFKFYGEVLPPGTKLVGLAVSIKDGNQTFHGSAKKIGEATGIKAKLPNQSQQTASTGPTVKPSYTVPKPPAEPELVKPGMKVGQDPTVYDKFEGSTTIKAGKIINGIETGSKIVLGRDIPPVTSNQYEEWSKVLSDGMTPAESLALDRWKGGFSTEMRKRQQEGTGAVTQSDLDCRTMLKKGVDFVGVTYRGFRGDWASQTWEKVKKAGVGSFWTEPASMCMSRNSETGLGFAKSGNSSTGNTEHDFLLKIKTKTGVFTGSNSGYLSEQEVIGRPGKWYRIERIVQDAEIAVNGGDNFKLVKWYVELTEVDI